MPQMGVSTKYCETMGFIRGKSVEVVEPDYAASNDPKFLKARIRELQKRLQRSETEKEILKKATAYFASQHP